MEERVKLQCKHLSFVSWENCVSFITKLQFTPKLRRKVEVNIVSVSFLRAEGRHATNGSLPYLLKHTALSLTVEARDKWSLTSLPLEYATGQWHIHIWITPYRDNSRCSVASALSACSFGRLMFCQAKVVVRGDRIQENGEIVCLPLKLYPFCWWHYVLALCLTSSFRMSAAMSFWIFCLSGNSGLAFSGQHESIWKAMNCCNTSACTRAEESTRGVCVGCLE